MKYLFLFGALLITSLTFSQSLSKDNAKFMIDVFFDGFHKGDSAKMQSVMVKNMRMQTVYTSKNDGQKLTQTRSSDFLAMIANRKPDQTWEERILDYKIEIDGSLATVWTPYQFYVNDQLSHCGANAFTLVQTNDGWKIYSIIDSRRLKDCDQ